MKKDERSIELIEKLLFSMEDYFYEEKIGSHILGVYECGERLYGFENKPESLLVLYMGSSEDLLNPTIKEKQLSKTAKFNELLNEIHFVEIFDYVKWTTRKENTEECLKLMQFAPVYSKVFFQEDSLNKLVALLYDLLSCHNFSLMNLNNPYWTIQDFLFFRMLYIYIVTNLYSPNINKEFETILPLSSLIIDYNDNIEEKILKKGSIYSQCHETDKEIIENKIKEELSKQEILSSKEIKEKTKKTIEELGKEVVKLYKFIL